MAWRQVTSVTNTPSVHFLCRNRLIVNQDISIYAYHKAGGGVNLPWFWYGRATGVPAPHTIHFLSEVKKTYPFIYIVLTICHCTYPYTIFHILPIQYTFWGKRYPTDILLKWKWYPFICWMAWFQPHVCVYLYNRSVINYLSILWALQVIVSRELTCNAHRIES